MKGPVTMLHNWNYLLGIVAWLVLQLTFAFEPRTVVFKGVPILHMDVTPPVVAIVGTDVKLSCSAVQWTDGYTITWSKNNTGEVLSKNLHIVSDPSKYSVTTVTSSELESTAWTLTIKDAVQTDGGEYTCSLKTEPPQFVTVPVIMQTPVISDLPTEVVRWDVSECCLSRGVSLPCMPLCNTMVFGFDVFEALRVSDRCRSHHDHWFKCLASERNHTPCCKRQHVPEKCMDLCLGNFSTVFREGNLDCLHFVAVIFQCFHDGRDTIPTPPRNVRVSRLGTDALRISWSPPLKHGRQVNYTVIYKATGNNVGDGKALVQLPTVGVAKTTATSELGLILPGLAPGESYQIYVVALNVAGSSQPSETVTVEIPLPNTVGLPETLLEGRILMNTTLNSLATLNGDKRLPNVTGEVLDVSTTTELNLRRNEAFPQDDYIVFDKCFKSRDFRSTCAEVFKVSSVMGKNATVIQCRDSLPRFVNCAADGADHRKCCTRNAVPDTCTNWCAGKPTGLFDVCHVFLPRILACFKEGRLFLPSEPQDIVGAQNGQDGPVTIQWRTPETRPEMVENYVVTVTNRKTKNQTTLVIAKDLHSVVFEPMAYGPEYEVFVQAENFHGLSNHSATLLIEMDVMSNNYEQNVQHVNDSTSGPAVAVAVALTGIGLVAVFVGTAYWLRRKRTKKLTTHPKCNSAEPLAEGEKLRNPVNAFYIPGYFGKRGASRKTNCSNDSGSYATSFSCVRQASDVSDAVYSDATGVSDSGAYLWMFKNDKKAAAQVISHNPSAKPVPQQRPSCSRTSSAEQNIYDNNLPIKP